MNEARDALLQHLSTALADDPRFVAAWLRGSFGRGTEDDLSDLDLTVVVVDDCADLLLRPFQAAGKTTPERLALLSQFGQPSTIHENNYNAPEGSTFTAVVYANAVMVDWILTPQSKAVIPSQARMLFAKVQLPTAPLQTVPDLDARMKEVSERVGFFWMMAAVAAKYHLRGDAVYFHVLLDMVCRTYEEAQALIDGSTLIWRSGSHAPFAPTAKAREQALRAMCADMLRLMPQIPSTTPLPSDPMAVIDTLLNTRTVTDHDHSPDYRH